MLHRKTDFRHLSSNLDVFLILFLVLISASPAKAQFIYTTNDGAITITGYTGTNAVVSIPETIDGLPVSIIEGFGLNKSIRSVIIPNGVTQLVWRAFEGCQSLTNIHLGDGLEEIGFLAFSRCTNLAAITVSPFNLNYSSHDGVLFNKEGTVILQCPLGKAGNFSIPDGLIVLYKGTFGNCTKLTSVTIPDSAVRVEFGAFTFCTGLTNVILGGGISNIATRLFFGCSSLQRLTIPDNVIRIEDEAFASCTGLTNITLGKRVAKLGKLLFNNCTNLVSISVDGQNSFYSSADGVLFNKSQTTLLLCPGGKLGSYSIPGSVTNVGIKAFENCFELKSVTVPKSVVIMGELAFSGCSSLDSVYFLGDAPMAERLFSVGKKRVYYLPGTKGWRSVFGGRPTFQWNAQVQTSDANFGVNENQFGYNISGANGLNIIIEACTDLENPFWIPLATNILKGDVFYFRDPSWTNYSGRFYRILPF